nr:hypothetical protein [uncultured Duganella sp.]
MAANGLHNLGIVFVFFSKSLQLFLSRPAVANHTALDFFLSLRVKPPVKFSSEVLTRLSVIYKNLNIFRYRPPASAALAASKHTTNVAVVITINPP